MVNICSFFLTNHNIDIYYSTPISLFSVVFWRFITVDVVVFFSLCRSTHAPWNGFCPKEPNTKTTKVDGNGVDKNPQYSVNRLDINGIYTSMVTIVWVRLCVLQSAVGINRHDTVGFYN